MRAAILLSALAVCGCRAQPKMWPDMSNAERLATLDAISNECHLARKTFELDGDELHFKPDPAEKFEAVDCALGKLRPIGGFNKMGFVGNEKYVDEKH